MRLDAPVGQFDERFAAQWRRIFCANYKLHFRWEPSTSSFPPSWMSSCKRANGKWCRLIYRTIFHRHIPVIWFNCNAMRTQRLKIQALNHEICRERDRQVENGWSNFRFLFYLASIVFTHAHIIRQDGPTFQHKMNIALYQPYNFYPRKL